MSDLGTKAMTDIDTLRDPAAAAAKRCPHCRGKGRYWSLTAWDWIPCPNCKDKRRRSTLAVLAALKARSVA